MIKEMNGIYNAIVQKRISLDEGVRQMIIYIYVHPRVFGLVHIDPDVKSNIIVKLLECLPTYIANYSNTKAFFSTYICSIVLNLLKSEYKEFYRQRAHESSIVYYLSEKYQADEECSLREGLYADAVEDSGVSYLNDSYTGTSYKKTAAEKKLNSTHMLILALKACYFLTESQICRLSKMTGYTEEEIYEYKRKLEHCMQQRLKRYKENQYRLNNYYMMKNRCFLQLMTMPPESALFNKLSKLYGYYTQSWRTKLRLSHRRGRLRPTNDEIARVLHIQAYQVSHALRYVRFVGKKYSVRESVP
ncbi:hypothetical protein V1L52_11455 [Treponema sp. HNW]|uniref:hypothetical protein n=1 Tax=Treponema sp. HNW TaxID=3116654 RepID=UPI003D136497